MLEPKFSSIDGRSVCAIMVQFLATVRLLFYSFCLRLLSRPSIKSIRFLTVCMLGAGRGLQWTTIISGIWHTFLLFDDDFTPSADITKAIQKQKTSFNYGLDCEDVVHTCCSIHAHMYRGFSMDFVWLNRSHSGIQIFHIVSFNQGF